MIHDWEKIFNEQANSGLSVKEYCKKNNLGVSTFYKHKKQCSNDIQVDNTFSIVDIVHHDQVNKISMIIDGHQIEFDPSLISKVIGALK